MSDPRILVVGIGSPHGDDQVGWRVAEALSERSKAGVCVRLARSPANLFDWLDGVDRLVICDACRPTEEEGKIRLWTWPAPQVRQFCGSGTHDLGLAAVLDLAQQLGKLPPQVTIWGVETSFAEPGRPMSDEGANLVPVVARLLQSDLEQGRREKLTVGALL